MPPAQLDDRTMRFTNQIRPLLIGLPLLVSQAFVAAQPAAGWDWNIFGANDTAQAAGQKPLAAVPGDRAIAPTNPRWTDGAVQQAYADGTQQANAVQQTAHTGPSRNGTLFGNSGPSGPTWRGQKLRMPTKIFVRSGNADHSPLPNPAAKNYPGAASTASAAARTRQGSSIPTAATTRPNGISRVAGHTPAPNQSRTAAKPRPIAPIHASAQQVSSAASKSSPTLAASAEPTLAEPEPAQSAPAAATNPATIEPKTPGDRLIMKAHEFSARAATEEDFTRLIETCRRARASQISPPLNDFANNLTAWSLNRRGQLKAELGHTKEAMLDFNDAVRSNPKLWRALHNRGVLKAQAGDFESAFDDFNLTIQFNSKFGKAYSNRAALFVVAGDLPAALDDYARAIEFDPNLAVAHRGRGRVCHLQGRLDESLDHYDAAVQLAPDDAYAIASRADLLTDLGRYVDAAKGYERAIELDPQSAAAQRGSAWLLATCPDASVRDANLAVQRAELSIQLDGQEEAISLDTLAAALASAGDFSAAMQTMRQAIEIAPHDERTVYQDRLKLYQRAKPYRIAPVRGIAQANYESE
jgi:tetratricopeptide (TPR) repeat protein